MTTIGEHNRKAFDMVLKAAVKLGKDLLFPIFEEMDRNPPELIDGEVKVHPQVKTDLCINSLKAVGSPAVCLSSTAASNCPHLVADACEFIFQAANYSAAAYAGLTCGCGAFDRILRQQTNL
jgi:hypothetical protein